MELPIKLYFSRLESVKVFSKTIKGYNCIYYNINPDNIYELILSKKKKKLKKLEYVFKLTEDQKAFNNYTQAIFKLRKNDHNFSSDIKRRKIKKIINNIKILRDLAKPANNNI